MSSKESSIIGRKPGNQALDGVKVLDFGWALVGSLTGKHLADHGAEVIKIESATRLDLLRISRGSVAKVDDPDDKPGFVNLNTSKYGMTLNVKHSRAREVLDRLIRWADVINENFTPGTLDKMGYGYQYAKSLKPDIIMVSGSAYGQTGPYAQEWGIDNTGGAWSGYMHLTGWPDRAPTGPLYGDVLVPYFNVAAVVAALDYRRRTGKGQHIDTAMVDACVNQITPALLDFQANGRLQVRAGNRIPNASPHGVFPCQGEDRWCAIAVFSEEQWRAFCRATGNPSWTDESRFATLELRKRNEDALDELIAEWTSLREAREVMGLMQEAGVPAGVVQDGREMVAYDPQLAGRHFQIPLEHPVIGSFGHPTPVFKLTKTEAQVRTGPRLGEHVAHICLNVLGISETEYSALAEDGVFK
jgi:benzylsuccinate CoA-transferase BbsF subunit